MTIPRLPRFRFAFTGIFLALFVLPACSPPDFDPDWTAEELYDYGMERMEQEDWLDAMDAFRAITLSHSGNDIVDDALYHQGRMHIELEEYPLAVLVFRRLISDFPQSPYSDESQYQLAYATFLQSNPPHLTQDKTFEAIRELQYFLDVYPDSEWTVEVHELLQECFDKVAEKDYRIGNLYYKLKDWEAARLYFGELLETYPMSNWALRAQYEIAESYAKEGKYSEAIEQLEIFIQSYPENELSAEASKRLAELRTEYEAFSGRPGPSNPSNPSDLPGTSDPLGPPGPSDLSGPPGPPVDYGNARPGPAATDESSQDESESGNSP